MTSMTPVGRTIVIKARRDTLALVAAAVAMTFALASVTHSRPTPVAEATPQPMRQAWAGSLSAMSADATLVTEPLSSASLVVAKSELSLPAMTVRPLVKLRGCEDSVCAARAPVPVPGRRPSTEVADTSVHKTSTAHKDKPGLMVRLNPLRHLPDMSSIGKPFVYAGNAVSGWFRRF